MVQPTASKTGPTNASTLLSAKDATELAAKLKALSDPSRLQLLSLISESGEMCVCDLTEPVGLSQPTVSHHLKVLADASLVHREQRGKWAYYSVDDQALADVSRALLP